MKKSSYFMVFLLLITVIVAGTALFLIFKTNNESKFDEQIKEAEALVSAGSYPEAIALADEILGSDSSSIRANQIKSDCAQMMQNYDLFRETNARLYELTQNNYYQDRLGYVEYGSRPANILNGGDVLETYDGTFVVSYDSDPTTPTSPVYTFNLWFISSNHKESVFLDQGVGAFIKDLQLWGNKLYFRSSQGLKVLDLYTKTITDLVIDGTVGGTPTDYISIDKLSIYNGEFYFIQTVVQGTYIEAITVSKCGLDGHNVATVVDFQGMTSVGIVYINSYFPMTDRVYFRTTNNTIYSLRVSMGGNVATLIESGNLAETFSVNQTDLYISGVGDDGTTVQIFKVNMATNGVVPVNMAIPMGTQFGITATDTEIYYFGAEGLDSIDLTETTVTPLNLPFEPGVESAFVYVTSSELFVYQTGNFNGTYKTLINRINRSNITENTRLFTGNDSLEMSS